MDIGSNEKFEAFRLDIHKEIMNNQNDYYNADYDDGINAILKLITEELISNINAYL